MSRKKRDLTADEHQLWDRVKHTTKPLIISGRKPPECREKKSQNGTSKPIIFSSTIEPSVKKIIKRPTASDLDRRTSRRLRRGNTKIEARLDLHGQTQGAAHHALRSFLHTAQRKGAGFALIITGKSGVLNRLVPLWLNEPGLRDYVSAISSAGPRHGGYGALYVRLRKV